MTDIQFMVHTFEKILFICEECGETVTMMAPYKPGTSKIRSYCCDASYEVSRKLDGKLVLKMLSDEEKVKGKVKEAVYGEVNEA